MALLAEYALDCAALPLVPVAARVPDAEITLRIGPGDDERPRFVARVAGADETVDAAVAAFGSTPFVGDSTLVGRVDDAREYKIRPGTSMAEQLGAHLDDLDDLRALYDTPLHVDRIHVTPDGWVQRGRFADRAAFDELRTFWQRNDVQFRLFRLTRNEASGGDGATDGLTDPQRAALLAAHDLGYFEIPRTATLADVASALDITASACSERLRRAQTHLVETHVADPVPTSAPHKAPQH